MSTIAATGLAGAAVAAAPTQQNKVCQAIATSLKLRVTRTCPKNAAQTLSFTVSTKAPSGLQATVAYSIVDTTADAQQAWSYDGSDGPETTLPVAGTVSGLASPSHVYLAAGQTDAEAVALVGPVIIDVILVPLTSTRGPSALKPTIETLMRNVAAVVRGDVAHLD